MKSYLYILPFKNRPLFKIGVSKYNLERIKVLNRKHDVDYEKSLIVDCIDDRLIRGLETELLLIFPRQKKYVGVDGHTEMRKIKYLPELLEIIKNKHPNLGYDIRKFGEIRKSEIGSNSKNTFTFSFLLKIETMEKLRLIEEFKRRKKFQYNVSDVIREGIKKMKKKYQSLPNRPEGLIPTRRGKHSNSEKKEKTFTSFRISGEDRDFIYDFMYFKNLNENGDLITSNFTKDDFMECLLAEFNFNF